MSPPPMSERLKNPVSQTMLLRLAANQCGGNGLPRRIGLSKLIPQGVQFQPLLASILAPPFPPSPSSQATVAAVFSSPKPISSLFLTQLTRLRWMGTNTPLVQPRVLSDLI